MIPLLLPSLLTVLIGAELGTVESFDAFEVGPFQKGHLDTWRWTADERERAGDASRLEIVADSAGDGRQLRVEVRDPQLFNREPLVAFRLAPHYPPETDALLVRLKVVRGQVRFYAGGPTAYYANSDVFTSIRTVAAEAEPRWVTVELSLNHPLWRNFRRSGISTEAPRNYYTRWAQEPLGFYLAAGTAGEFLIDRIDAAAHGEGRPFPKFAADEIDVVRTIADFEDGRRDAVFTWYMADRETEWFDESWKRTKPLRFAPQQLAVIDDGAGGRKSLTSTGHTAEEVHGTGVRTVGAPQANALAVTVAADAPGEQNVLLGAGPTVPIDFLVFVASPSSPSSPFAWEPFGPSDELRKYPGPGFDYHLSYRLLRERSDVSFAIYQTRRYLQPQTWTKLVLPADDFTCIYGHGADRRRFTNHEPLACGDVVAVGWINPWCRSGNRSPTATTRIDDLAFVRVPGAVDGHRSFWQLPSPAAAQLIEQEGPRVRIRRMLLSGDDDGLAGP